MSGSLSEDPARTEKPTLVSERGLLKRTQRKQWGLHAEDAT